MTARSRLRSSVTGKIRSSPKQDIHEYSPGDPEVSQSVVMRPSTARCSARRDEGFSGGWAISRRAIRSQYLRCAKSLRKSLRACRLKTRCDTRHLARLVQSQQKGGSEQEPGRRARALLRRIAWTAVLLALAFATCTPAQVQVGDDLKMNLNGLLTGGYAANYGDAIPSNHGLNFGGSAQLSGSYYNPNFLSFTATPYYNQSRADSAFQSLTDASGIDGTAHFFAGSRFPGFVNYHYDRNSTGTFGLINTPNFTTVGTSQGFGVGWSALIPDWPTFSVSYAQGSGNGTLYGTNEESNSSTKTLNVHSTYRWAGWLLSGNYQYMNISSAVPFFLTTEQGTDFYHSSGNGLGINASHPLPWHGSVSFGYNRSTYNGETGSTMAQSTGTSSFTTDQQTALVTFHPSDKLSLFTNEAYTDNLSGYLYQSIITGGGGIPIAQPSSQSDSFTMTSGVSYQFTRSLFGVAQITYFDQSYFGNNYQGSFFMSTVGYGRRILDTFTFSASVVESTNKFTDNALGFIANVNGFHHFGAWELSSNFNYAQNVQTLLVTYTTSYYMYGLNLHRRLGHGMQWTGAFNGNHSGFSQNAGTVNASEAFSTSLALRRIAVSGNYNQYRGQSILTSSGIVPITTPGLPPVGLVVYNGESYGAGVAWTPIPRLTISGNYAHATSNTLSPTTPSNNKTEMFYSQLQYRLRQITVLAGYTKFSQGISASGIPPSEEYSYFIGVTRSFNFF
jgi:hypothetical protein